MPNPDDDVLVVPTQKFSRNERPVVNYNAGSSLEVISRQSLIDAAHSNSTIHLVYEKLKVTSECLSRVVDYLNDKFDQVMSDYDGFLALGHRGDSTYCSVFISTGGENNVPQVELYGSREALDLLVAGIKKLTPEIGPIITWVHDRYMRTIEMPLNIDHLPTNQMYPFVNKPLDEYYHEFYDSSSNVMICMGEPGTGKTTFLRGMLKSLNASAILSYQQDIFESDEFFVKFLTSDIGIMIIEDADVLLSARQDGNSAMQRFLNAADGLVTIPKRKLVFTTNLPNVNNIDPALVRSGRCFDVLKFRKLQPDEIQSLRGVVGLQDNPLFRKPQTLATVMNARPSC